MKWEKVAKKPNKTLYESSGGRYGWQIIAIDTQYGPEDVAILRYRHTDTQSFAVGEFRSPAEAMFAAEMYRGQIDCEAASVKLDRLGFDPARTGVGADLFVDNGDGQTGHFMCFGECFGETFEDSDSTEIDFSILNLSTEPIVKMFSLRVPQDCRPPGIENHRLVDEMIVIELLTTRLAKGPGHYAEPMTTDELESWRSVQRGPVEGFEVCLK